MGKALVRGIASVVAILVYSVVNFLLTPAATMLSGETAAKQFDNSTVSYVEATYGSGLFGHLGIPALVLLVVLALIWWGDLRRAWTRLFPAVVIAFGVLLSVTTAQAYYDKNDFSEAYFILPNESAFFIPDVGANKDTQAKFGSTEYLEANKIPAKRFAIPHAKFSGSGAWTDFYVPTGRLIIVDRTPYNREWVAAHDRGTSARNESFPCQSSEGINITTEVAIATSVSEENASKFLYWFGVRPPQGNRNDPNVVFTSVYYGKSLAEVMDSVGRGKVQSLVCHEIGARTFEKANADVNVIMDAVEKAAGTFLASRGITLDYIGWAGTFTFDKDVQQAVNDRYTAEKIAPVLDTLKAKAIIDTLQKWDGKAPTTFVSFASSFFDGVADWIKAPKK